MKDERIIEEMARLDGFLAVKLCAGSDDTYMGQYEDSGEKYWTRLPLYLTDHNACARVIDGVDAREFALFAIKLQAMMTHSCLKATPRQKCIAILKAYGKWEG